MVIIKKILFLFDLKPFKYFFSLILSITLKSAIKNFKEILDESDAIIIMRSYLMVHIPVEKLHF
jgi:pyruvate kinase